MVGWVGKQKLRHGGAPPVLSFSRAGDRLQNDSLKDVGEDVCSGGKPLRKRPLREGVVEPAALGGGGGLVLVVLSICTIKMVPVPTGWAASTELHPSSAPTHPPAPPAPAFRSTAWMMSKFLLTPRIVDRSRAPTISKFLQVLPLLLLLLLLLVP